MRRLRLHRWLILPSAVLWLLAQLTMTGALAAPLDPASVSPLTRMTVICTEQGLKVVPLRDDHRDGSPVPDCHWCKGASAMPEAPPPDGACTPAALVFAADLARAHQLLRQLGALSAATPRAPPAA